jgi:proteasome lid subunit RPN8/RPN11
MTIEIDQFLSDFQTAKTEQGDSFDGASFGRDYDRGAQRSRTQPEDDDSLNRKGFIMETAEALAGGAVDTAELWMRAVRAVDPLGGNETIRNFATFGLDSIKNFVAKHPSLSPDNQAQEGVSRWWQQGVRSMMPSMSAAIPGMLAGAVGGPIGAAVGGGAVSGAIFGLAEFDTVREEGEDLIREKMASGDMTEAEAIVVRHEIKEAAMKAGAVEGGLEGIANAVQVKVLSKWFPGRSTLKNLIKAPVKDIFKKGAKEAIKTGAKQLALTTPVEVGTEFAQSALENKFRRDVGLTDMNSWSAGMDALGPAFVTNLLFFGMGKSANAAQRWGIRHALEDAKASPQKRMKAVKDIAKIVRGMEDVNADAIANKMEAVGLSYVASGMKMNINNDLGMETMLTQYKKELQDGKISNISSVKLQMALQKEMDRENLPLQQRIPAFQMMQGISTINKEQKAIDFLRSEEEKNKETKEATAPDMLDANAESAVNKEVKVEKTIKVEKEEKPKKEEKKPVKKKKVKVTEKAQKKLINVGRDAVVPDATKNAEREAELKKAKAIKPEPGVAVIPDDDDIPTEEVVAKKTTTEDVAKAKAELPEGKPTKETKEKFFKKLTKQSKEPTVDKTETVPEPTGTTEPVPKKEVKAQDKISKEQERQVRKELTDPELFPDEKKDLEKILVDAGLPLEVAKKEAVVEPEPEKAEGISMTGLEPRNANAKLKKGEAPYTESEKQDAVLSKQIFKAIAGFNTSSAKKKAAAQADYKQAVAERNDLRKKVLSESIKSDVATKKAEKKDVVAVKAKAEKKKVRKKKVEKKIVEKHPELKSDIVNLEIAADALMSTENIIKGNGISPKMMKQGKIEVSGMKAETAEDIAVISQVFRNPQYETFRIIYTRLGHIVGHEARTSRLPGSVSVFIDDQRTEIDNINAKQLHLKADKVWFVHNHPSGNAIPSPADRKFTKQMAAVIPAVAGHVVVDSGEYAHITPTGHARVKAIKTDDAILKPSVPNRLLGREMSNIDAVIKYGKELQHQEGFMTLTFMSANTDIRGIVDVPVKQLMGKDTDQLRKDIRDLAVMFGSVQATLALDTSLNPEAGSSSPDALISLIRDGMIVDAILYKEDQTVSIRRMFSVKSKKKNRKKFLGGDIQTTLGEDTKPFSDEAIAIANKTNVDHLVKDDEPRVATRLTMEFTEDKDASILDFGSGKAAKQTKILERQGYTNVTAYDFGTNVVEGLHDTKALDKQYDVVQAGNVLNVQSNEEMLRGTLNQISSATASGGFAIMNYPATPRKMKPSELSPSEMESRIKDAFIYVRKVGTNTWVASNGIESSVEEEKSAFEEEGGRVRKITDKDFTDNPHVDRATQEVFNKKLSPRVEGITIKERLDEWKKNWWLKLQQGAIDQFASLRKLDDKLWKLAQITTSASGAVEALLTMGGIKLTEGVPDLIDAKGGKGLFNVIKPLGEELELWLGWIAGNRAEDLLVHNKEKNLSEDEIKLLKGLTKGKMKDGRSRRSVYRDVWTEFSKLHQSVLDVAQETGTIGTKERESWREGYYLPFFRLIEDREKNQTAGPKTLGGIANQNAFKELKGKDVPIADMLTNIILNWNHLVGASLKNQVAVKSLHKAITMKIEGGQPVAERINVDIDVVETESGQFKVVDALSGKDRGSYDTFEAAQERQEELTRMIEERLAKKSTNAVFVREDGKKVWYEVNEPNIYQALTNLNFEGFNSRPMKALRSFKRLLTLGVTSSPDFKVRNLFRDTVGSAATSKISLNLIGNVFGSGRRATQKSSESFMRMMAGGGNIQFGHMYGTDPEKVQAQLNRNLRKEGILDNKTGWDKFKNASAKGLDAWNEFGSRWENLNRAALFEQTLDKEGFLEANFEARDLLDFNRHGAWPAVRFLIDTVPFMNARIQGLSKLGRSMTKEQGARLALVSGGVAMASMALYLAYKDDDEFKEREEWDRDTYWWFKIPFTDYTFRLPKPFEIGVIGTLAERTLEQIVDDKVHGALFAERLKFALTQTFSFDIAPQAVKPVLELMANKNFFTQRPIETLAMENLSPTERRKAWTSETAILMSQGFSHIPWDKVQLSPVQIEHLVNGYTGWLGGFVLGGVDMLTQRAGGFPNKPSFRIEDYSLIGSFVGETPSRQTKYSSIFYEGLKEMNQTYADVRNYRTLGETEKALNYARKHKDKLRFRKLANKIQKNVATLTKRVRLTRLDKNMSAQEKRAKIDRLTVMKNKLLKMAVEKIKL